MQQISSAPPIDDYDYECLCAGPGTSPCNPIDLGLLEIGQAITDNRSTALIPSSNTECFFSPAIFYTFTLEDVTDLNITVCAGDSSPTVIGALIDRSID